MKGIELENYSLATHEAEGSQLQANRRQALTRLERVLQTPEEQVLREHQMSMTGAFYNHLKAGNHAGYMSEATGVGKSAVAVRLAEILGLKTFILSPTLQIADQNRKEAGRFAPSLRVTTYDGHSKDLSGDVITTTYQSTLNLTRGVKEDYDPSSVGFLICDEGDLGLGEQQHTIYRSFPNAIKLGLTATPYFAPLDGFIQRGIVDENEEWVGMFTNLIHETTLEEALERGILSPAHIYLLKTDTRVSDITILSSGEYRQSDLEKHFITESRNALVIGMLAGVDKIPGNIRINDAKRQELDAIHKMIAGKRTVILGINVDHIIGLEDELRRQGVSAASIHGLVSPDERRRILASHAEGVTQAVLGVNILGRGWDSPETEVTIHTKPNYSGRRVVQEFGRGLRPSPLTGKEEAIAIQLVDQFAKRNQSAVLITDIFDPEYVLRGASLGIQPNASRRERTNKPIVTFSGMDIEAIIEEARSRDLLKSRFTQGSIEEISKLLDKIVGEVLEQNPNMGIYELFRAVERDLPGKIPAVVQEKSVQAIASMDTNTRKLGEQALLLLNMKTILSALDLHIIEGVDTEEDREEMIASAITSTLGRLSNLKPNLPVPQQIHGAAVDGIVEYIAQKDNVPASWIRDPGNRQFIVTRIKERLVDGREKLDDEGLKALAEELSGETGINEERLFDYIKYITLLNMNLEESANVNEDSTVYEVVRNKLAEEVGGVLETLADREKRVIDLRFGLKDGREQTLEAVGREFGVKGERIRQIEAKALRKLRHPINSRRLRDYMDGDYGDVMPIKYKESPSSVQLEARRQDSMDYSDNPYSIELFDVPYFVKDHLIASGIREIGDFFSAAPSELLEGWTGNRQHLIWTVKGVLDSLGVGEDSRAESDTHLLYHITNGILYKEEKPSWLDVSARKALYRKGYEELSSFFSESINADNK